MTNFKELKLLLNNRGGKSTLAHTLPLLGGNRVLTIPRV